MPAAHFTRPLSDTEKALELSIRGGAGRNHTADRIQLPVPSRSDNSSAHRIARTRSSQGTNIFLSSSAGAWRPYSHSSNASAYFTAFPRSAP
jgi:hypothetical protein